MGFKCRLFGHTYGNPEVERNRTEEGDEVVVTVRNVKRCERCGDEQMVNQTKEVTSVRTPDEVGLDAVAEASAPPEPEAGSDGRGSEAEDSPVTPVADPTAEAADPAETAVDPGAEPDVGPAAGAAASSVEDAADAAPADASGADDGWDEDAVVEAPDATAVEADAEPTAEAADDGWETGSDDWDDVDPEPDVDDAVILDPADTERDEVQWPEESDADPEAEDAEAAGAAASPDVPEPTDGEPDDAEIIDAGGSEADPVEETGGGWPDHDATDEGYSAAPNGDVDAEFVGDGLTPEVNGGAPDDPDAVDGITVGGGDGPAAEQSFAGAGAEVDADAGGDSGAAEGFVRAGESTTEDVPSDRVEFYCPNCGHARTAGASSIRAGDICPECKQGYIAERER